MQLNITTLLHRLISERGSDLHLRAGCAPRFRIDGALCELGEYPVLPAAQTTELVRQILTPEQLAQFTATREVDCSFAVQGLSRFRVNVFAEQQGPAAVLRAIPMQVCALEDLGLPPVVERLCHKPRGLVLVTGPTGCGKSTTLAALLDKINRTRPAHILTIEDPIEFIHSSKQSTVSMREVGSHTRTFGSALRAALRQDPDIVLVGEMRDLETIELALRIAETGHLTFGTLHTNSAHSTITRIVDVFPAGQQAQIRTQLSQVLEGVVCQQLLPRADGPGRLLALEVMIPTPALRHLIRKGQEHQIYAVMTTEKEKGMITLNESLAELVGRGLLETATALHCSSEPDELRGLIASKKNQSRNWR